MRHPFCIVDMKYEKIPEMEKQDHVVLSFH